MCSRVTNEDMVCLDGIKDGCGEGSASWGAMHAEVEAQSVACVGRS